MDPRQRDQQQTSQHHQGQIHPGIQNHNSSYNNSAFNYQDSNSLQPQDDFNQFFNPDPTPTFQNGWDGTPMLDPQLNASAFSQPANDHWSQQPQQSMQQDDFVNAFARPQTDFGFPSYNGHDYAGFTPNTYDPTLTYANNSMLNNNQFTNASSGFNSPNRPIQGDTVSPSVLESYPNPYGSFANQTEDHTPTPDRQTPVQSVEPQMAQRQRDDYYSEELSKRLAAAIPSGVRQGSMLIKDPENLTKTVKAQKLAPFVYVGTNKLESDDPRVIFPRPVQRKSSKELKRKVLQDQSGRPWEASQQPILKKMKIKLGVPKAVKAQAAAAAGSIKVEAVSSESASEESSDEDSDDSDSELEIEPEEQSPLPASRPTDKVKAAEYDTIKAVWAKRSGLLPGSAIRTAVTNLWNVVRPLRESFRSATQDLSQAEQMKDNAKASQHKARVDEHREIFSRIVKSVLTHGHPDIVERLGEVPPLMAVFYQIIADRFKTADYNHPIIVDCLKLLCGCTTIDQDLFSQAKLDKVVLKLSKKGNEEVKALCEQLNRNVEKATAQKSGESKSKEKAAASPSKPLSKANGALDTVAGVKRPRSSDVAASQSAKKPVAPVGTKGVVVAGKSVNGTTSKLGAAGKPGASLKTENKTTASSTASKPQVKEKHVTAKPSSFLASLTSAHKKPGTSIAAQKASQGTEAKASKPAESKIAPASAPKAGFSFSQTLANLAKPKPVETVKQVTDDRPPETEEEKKKRIRKEERRKLRVQFKPGESLVEVLLFHHDPEEELGHDDNMIRDVGDVKNEGRMLKMHKDKEFEDDDDEEDVLDLEVPWYSPSEVDFSDVDYDILLQNFTGHGGQMDIVSPEKEKQEQREREKFVVIYALLSDIPPNPREPMDPYNGETIAETAFGDPIPETRARETRFYARNSYQQQPQMQAQQQTAPAPNMNALLSMLSGQAQQQQPQPPVQQQAPVSSALESIFAQFSGNSAGQQMQMQIPPQQQPQHQPQPQQPQMDQSILNALSIFNQQQNQQQQIQYNPTPAAAPTTDLSALLAQMGGQPSAQAQAQAQSYNSGGQFHEHPERKRQWSSHEGDGNNNNKRFKGNYSGEKPKFVLPCRFYKEGKCLKGDKCTYVHEN